MDDQTPFSLGSLDQGGDKPPVAKRPAPFSLASLDQPQPGFGAGLSAGFEELKRNFELGGRQLTHFGPEAYGSDIDYSKLPQGIEAAKGIAEPFVKLATGTPYERGKAIPGLAATVLPMFLGGGAKEGAPKSPVADQPLTNAARAMSDEELAAQPMGKQPPVEESAAAPGVVEQQASRAMERRKGPSELQPVGAERRAPQLQMIQDLIKRAQVPEGPAAMAREEVESLAHDELLRQAAETPARTNAPFSLASLVSSATGDLGKVVGEAALRAIEPEPSEPTPSVSKQPVPREGATGDLEDSLTKGTVAKGNEEQLPGSVADQVLRQAAARTGEKVPVPWDASDADVVARQPRVPEIMGKSIRNWEDADFGAVYSVTQQMVRRLKTLYDTKDQLVADEGISSWNETTENLHAQISAQLAKMSQYASAAGRSLNFLKRYANDFGYDGFEMEALRARRGEPLSAPQKSQLMSLVSKGDLDGANSFIRSLQKFTPVEQAVMAWKDALISGLTTAEKIGVSPLYSLFGALTKPGRVALSSVLSAVTGAYSDVTLSPAEFSQAFGSSMEGMSHRLSQISKGISPRLGGPAGMDVQNVFGMNLEARPFGNMLGGVPTFLDNLIKRTHSGLHGVALEPNYEFARMNFSKAIAETIVRDNPKLTTADIPRLAAEFMEDPDVKGMAQGRAAKQTFLNENMASKGASMLRNYLERNWGTGGKMASIMSQYVVPFARISYNLVARGAEMTPVGLMSAGAQLIKLLRLSGEGIRTSEGAVDVTRALKVIDAQAEFTRRFMMGGAGTLVPFSIGYFLHKNGMMTGSAPESAWEKKMWDIQGRGPFMFTSDGGRNWHNPALLGPFATAVAMGAEYHAMSSDPTASLSEKLIGGAQGLAAPVAKESFLENVGTTASAIAGDKAAKGTAGREMVAGLVPNIVREARRAVDPYSRQPSGFAQTLEAEIPGLSENVPRKLGAAGTPLMHKTGASAFTPQPWPGEKELNFPANLLVDQVNTLRTQFTARIGGIQKQLRATAADQSMNPTARAQLMKDLVGQLQAAQQSFSTSMNELMERR